MHTLFIGVLMGWGAAIPVGPVNLEIARRSLSQRSLMGIVFGLGACSADLIYLVLMCFGAVYLLEHPLILNGVGIVGSSILLWFAWQAFHAVARNSHSEISKTSWAAYRDGLLMTLFNPYTILFWGSISSQVAMITGSQHASLSAAGFGLILGTVSWVLVLNGIIHVNKKRISDKVHQYLSGIGGLILLSFALFGLVKSMYGLISS